MADGGLKYTAFDTAAGWVGVTGSARGLLRITLPQHSLQDARQQLGDSVKYAAWSPQFFADLTERLRRYFAGYEVSFGDELDLSGYTRFQHEVWRGTMLIPYGETRSYAWVAERIGSPAAARGVGQALGRNPLPIVIPCHRVIASDGTLCGFAGGLKMKEYLLSLEASSRAA